MPTLRAPRALRYDPVLMPDLSAVLCPPYDIISPASRERLLARDPRNAVRLELPQAADGDEDGRYRAAARTLAEWRSDGTLVKDRQPTVHVHEMRWDPGVGEPARALGFFARLRLEPFGPTSGVRPHERTMSGPKEDRYRLLKATGANLSPVVLLHEADQAETGRLIGALTDRAPDATARTDDGVEHRTWAAPVEVADDGSPTGHAASLLSLVEGQPLTIADGHHRYETALRYREERGQNQACESDPAWDYVLALLYHVGSAPPVHATHRVLREGPSGEELLRAVDGLFAVERVAGPQDVVERMSRSAQVADDATGTGRIGLVSGSVAAVLQVAVGAIGERLDASRSPEWRGLDVNSLGVALERLGVETDALATTDRLEYARDARPSIADAAEGRVAAAFLLDPPPTRAVTRVAAAGEVMPQKSTYFDPKAPTGLVFGPLEW